MMHVQARHTTPDSQEAISDADGGPKALSGKYPTGSKSCHHTNIRSSVVKIPESMQLQCR